MGRLYAAVATVSVCWIVAACGDDATAVRISVDRDGGGPEAPITGRLVCPSDTYPGACADLARVGGDVWDTVPASQACTALYAGPEVAHIEGTVDGDRRDGTFTRTDGCEVHRFASVWRILLVVLAPRPPG